jgi:hypothetical protein
LILIIYTLLDLPTILSLSLVSDLGKKYGQMSGGREVACTISFVHNVHKMSLWLQEATEEELERLLDRIMVLFRFIHGKYLI